MRSVVILGSTGSIGESALKVVAASGGALRVVGLGARSNGRRVMEQACEFGVRHVALDDPKAAALARADASQGCRVYDGPEGLCALAALPEADMVLCALVGLAGLRPTLTAMEAGHDVALATKEVLVAAGEIVMHARTRHGVRMMPVDSEHSALFQGLEARGEPYCVRRGSGSSDESRAVAPETQVRRVLLTASGGPFAGRAEVDFDRVTLDEALQHPRWSMGPKVTIDSSTMMNKGLEVMEALWLFGLPLDRIEVLIHPESIVHSLVEFQEGTTLAQLSPPDMRLPIHYALHWPRRRCNRLPGIDLTASGRLTFSAPDMDRFPCLRLARHAAATGGTMPAVLNAANEVAVAAFLSGRIRFSGIWRVTERVLEGHRPTTADSLETIEGVDRWARQRAHTECEHPRARIGG